MQLQVNLPALGFGFKFRVDIKINPRALNRAMEKSSDDPEERGLKETKEAWRLDPKEDLNPQEVLAYHIFKNLAREDVIIEDVAVMLGDPADLTATVRLKDSRRMYSFITKDLRTLPSIENTTTCIEAWSCAEEREHRFLIATRQPRVRQKKTPR